MRLWVVRAVAVWFSLFLGMNGFHGAEALGATPSGLEARLGELATSIVNIELTLRVEYGYGGSSSDDEATVEVRGSIVDPGGLILVSNLYLAPQRMRQLAGSFGEGGDEFRFDLKPTAIRIQVPGITEDQPAFLAASDSDLDLAFLQLEQVPQKSLPAVDFSKARPARVGEEVMVVSRLLENFDRAPFLFRGFVTGELKKPRRSWVVQLPPSGLGLPVFAVSDGVPLGVLATIFSPVENTRDAGGWLSGFVEGSGDPARGPIGLFLIPAERVQAAVELARQRARELLKERTGAREPSPAP